MAAKRSRSKPSAQQVAVVGAVLAAPFAILLAVLVAGGRLAAGPALVGGLLAAAAVLLLVWRSLAALHAVREELDRMPGRGTGKVPGRGPAQVRRGPVAVLAGAVGRLRVRIAEQHRRMEADLALAESVNVALPAPMLLLDGNRRVLIANAAAREFFARDPAGLDLSAVLRDPNVLEAVQAVLDGAAERDVDFTQPVPVERSLNVMIRPLRGPSQAGAAALVLIQDLTAAKRVDQMRADFVANVGHELKTPLASLIGFIETLERPASEDAAARQRFLAIMRDQAERMARIIEDLLSLSRIELEEHTPPTGRVALAPMLQGLAEAMLPQAGARGMHFELDMPGAVPDVAGDRDQVTQVFQNLLDNAVKYGHADTAVRVAVAVETDFTADSARAVGPGPPQVAVSVEDRSDGIPDDQRVRLTERFYRVDQARSRELGGTGLGLAIVKHIVNRHRGSLDISSVLGQGSTFTIRLPVAD